MHMITSITLHRFTRDDINATLRGTYNFSDHIGQPLNVPAPESPEAAMIQIDHREAVFRRDHLPTLLNQFETLAERGLLCVFPSESACTLTCALLLLSSARHGAAAGFACHEIFSEAARIFRLHRQATSSEEAIREPVDFDSFENLASSVSFKSTLSFLLACWSLWTSQVRTCSCTSFHGVSQDVPAKARLRLFAVTLVDGSAVHDSPLLPCCLRRS